MEHLLLYLINKQIIKHNYQFQYTSDDALVGAGIFPTHFSVKNIRPYLTTSEDGLRTLNIYC